LPHQKKVYCVHGIILNEKFAHIVWDHTPRYITWPTVLQRVRQDDEIKR